MCHIGLYGVYIYISTNTRIYEDMLEIRKNICYIIGVIIIILPNHELGYFPGNINDSGTTEKLLYYFKTK